MKNKTKATELFCIYGGLRNESTKRKVIPTNKIEDMFFRDPHFNFSECRFQVKASDLRGDIELVKGIKTLAKDAIKESEKSFYALAAALLGCNEILNEYSKKFIKAKSRVYSAFNKIS